jgi:hypothetical protein
MMMLIKTMMRVIIMSLPTIKSQRLSTRQFRLPVMVLQVQTSVTNYCTAKIKHQSRKYASQPYRLRSTATKTNETSSR